MYLITLLDTFFFSPCNQPVVVFGNSFINLMMKLNVDTCEVVNRFKAMTFHASDRVLL
jgi:hypothetical protein